MQIQFLQNFFMIEALSFTFGTFKVSIILAEHPYAYK